MHLTAEERGERLPRGRHLRYRHRIGWSFNILKAAGYGESPASGIWRITDRGRELLAANPQAFNGATTRTIVREGRARAATEAAGPPSEPPAVAQQSPEELIDGALTEIERAVARELLERIAQSTPTFFEGVVLELLHALGYGGSDADLNRVGGTW